MIEITVVIAVVVGVVEALKKLGLPSKFAPLVSIVFGVAFSFLTGGDAPATELVFAGFIIGLTSAGLYSGTKATIKG